MEPRVLFLHGLESGPNGIKARFLRENFPGLVTPELANGLPPPEELSNLVMKLASMEDHDRPERNQAINPSDSTAAFRDALQNCANIAVDSMHRAEKPIDVICGSSWGGAIALWLMHNGIWRDATILIAPALKRVLSYSTTTAVLKNELDMIYSNIRRTVKDPSRVIVIHGTEDVIIPLDDSRELCAATGFRLIEVPGGDHSLNSYLVEQGFLLHHVKELALRIKAAL